MATAPLSSEGHVNLSPKGLDTFRILSPQQVAYLDLTGSGNETSAHLQENGRITLMFCALEKAPSILRLYGKGRTVLPGSPEWKTLYSHFVPIPGARQIIVADIDRVQTSCVMAVPLYTYQGQRDALVNWAANRGEENVKAYQHQNNQTSIDGLATPLGQLNKQTPSG